MGKKAITAEELRSYLHTLETDPEERQRMARAWAREIRKEERKNPKNASIDFMKAIKF